jgi:membrane protein YdbS with pleckstrin-like domain
VDEPRTDPPTPTTEPPTEPETRTAEGELALWPGDVTWRPVSEKLLMIRRAVVATWLVPVAGAAATAAAVTDITWLPATIGVLGLLLLAWWWQLESKAVRSWGYAEREDDLLIRHGVLVHRMTVVPYGRMQFVDVRVGPVERALGLATVRLHTAAAATDAFIPGLPSAEATRLREKLAALGQARAAGL